MGLLGTKYTLEEEFYKQRIIDANIHVSIPTADEIQSVNDVMFNELVFGKTIVDSKNKYLAVVII